MDLKSADVTVEVGYEVEVMADGVSAPLVSPV